MQLTIIHFVPSLLDGLGQTVDVFFATVHAVLQSLTLMLQFVHGV